MSDSPLYSFNRHPRFSANVLADYLCTTNAEQREGVLRKAKFPRKMPSFAYQQIAPTLRRFLSSNTGNVGLLDDHISRLRIKAAREEGYTKDEALRCISALEAFKDAYRRLKLGKAVFLPGPQDTAFNVEGVRVTVRLDPPIVEESDDRTACGGCVLFLANTPESRKNIEERRRHAAAIILWSLQTTSGNIEPLPRLCMSFDAFGSEIVKASASNERFRRRASAACREAFDCWNRIEPPLGYDGPEWKE